MSTDREEIKATSQFSSIQVTSFWFKGRSLQLTQGLGIGMHDPGFIKLDVLQALELRDRLDQFLSGWEKS